MLGSYMLSDIEGMTMTQMSVSEPPWRAGHLDAVLSGDGRPLRK